MSWKNNSNTTNRNWPLENPTYNTSSKRIPFALSNDTFVHRLGSGLYGVWIARTSSRMRRISRLHVCTTTFFVWEMIERDLCSSDASYRCTGDVTEWTWSVLISLEHQREKRWTFPKISKENSMLCTFSLLFLIERRAILFSANHLLTHRSFWGRRIESKSLIHSLTDDGEMVSESENTA